MSSSHAFAAAEPHLSIALVERVLTRLGLSSRPTLDLAGLNTLYAAICLNIPFDNVQKRIWFAGDRRKPATGGDPVEYFENWVKHGTGGTCWPDAGGMYALARALGFRVRRAVGTVVVPNYPAGANHGSGLVELDGIDYVFDLAFGAFKVLPLVPGQAASTETGIHTLQAVPTQLGGFEMFFHLGWTTETLQYHPEPEYDPVDHNFFLTRYEIANSLGFFNDTVLVSKRFSDSIITVGRGKKLVLTAAGIEKTELTQAQRDEVLIQELGLSPEIVSMVPPDFESERVPF